MSRIALSAAEKRVLLLATPLRAIHRPGFRGEPWRLSDIITGTPRAAIRFPEALIAALIGKGLLSVTQCAKDLPDRANPGTTYNVPFSCILSKAGLEQRSYLIADGGIRAANDAGGEERAA